ncbi:MAG: signal recognition particle protein [Bacilli bacterium]
MAFENLTEKFGRIFKKIRGQSSLSSSNMKEMLGEIKIALLEADVNYKVVRDFLKNVENEAIGQQVLLKVNPSQMITKIVHDQLVDLLGSENIEIHYNSSKPTIIMLVGLQGIGKTTTVAKLGYLMKNKLNKKVLFAAADVYRPAAVEQLQILGKEIGIDTFFKENATPVEIAKLAKEKAYNDHLDVLIIDTAGRLQIDETLMEELEDIEDEVNPEEILLLVDAMSGQDAANVANEFNTKLSLTGVIMTKLDGDARGGSALSIKSMTGLPIKFAGVGEKIENLDIFYPERMADRILGMGDVVSLVETVQENIDQKQAERAAKKLLSGEFTLDDMLDQLKTVRKMGSLGGLMAMIPGMPKISKEQLAQAEKEMNNFEIIMDSMTLEERANPALLKNSRKVRIAKGCGKNSADINRMLKKYDQSKIMVKQLKGMKNGGIPPSFMGK